VVGAISYGWCELTDAIDGPRLCEPFPVHDRGRFRLPGRGFALRFGLSPNLLVLATTARDAEMHILMVDLALAADLLVCPRHRPPVLFQATGWDSPWLLGPARDSAQACDWRLTYTEHHGCLPTPS
jgi:hypothetical protein